MKPSRFSLGLLVACASLLPFTAAAQTVDNAQMNDRLSHIEHDVMLLQRQLSRDGAPPPGSAGNDADVPAGGSAQLEVRLSAIEDQLRELRGKVEESDNRTAKLNESFEKFKKDTEFRFNELGTPQAQLNAVPKPVALAPGAQPLGETPPSAPLKPQTPAPTATAPREPEKPPVDDTTAFSSPRELYNYAFRLLNQTQYEEAANVFDSFTKKYPKDPLVGNAFYWEGETYYIRRDYVNSADYFRQGFEAMPEGPKAADNLLKLAMSLDALNRDKEACLVLQQVVGKFKKTASSVADRAEQESKRIGCNKT